MSIPRFHTRGKDEDDGYSGHFYALAYVVGRYVSPSGKTNSEAFHVLNFSPSERYARFNFMTVSPVGELFQYASGLEELDSPEYALLRAWREERVPTHAWRLFPGASIEEAAFGGDAAARAAYETARRRVALLIYHARTHVWVAAQFPAEPLFRFSETDLPQPMIDTPEYAEISKYVADTASSL